MSMISELIENLKRYARFSKVTNPSWSNVMSQAADTIEALSAKLAENMERRDSGGWIPCEDRLPPRPKENPCFEGKPLEVYLVSVEGADYAFRAFWNGKFFADGWSRVNATAWMPLPEPYCPEACESIERNDAGNEG